MYKQISLIFIILMVLSEGLNAQSNQTKISYYYQKEDQVILADVSISSDETEKITIALEELEETKNKFNSALELFIKELENVAQTQNSVNLVPLQDASVKLDKIIESHQYLNQLLEDNALDSQEKIKNNSQNIGVLLQRFGEIIYPLKNGLDGDKVREIQEYLDFFQRRNINPQFYGIYGTTTQEEIENYAQENIQKLLVQIEQINEAINEELQEIQHDIETTNLQNLEEQLNNLQSENNNLQSEVNQLKEQKGNSFFLFFSVILSVLAFLGILLLIFKKDKSKSSVGSAKVYNLTTNDLSLIEEEMYDKIAQQFQEQMQFLESRFKALEGTASSGKNIKQFSPSTIADQKLRIIATNEQGINEIDNDFNPKIISPYDILVNDYNSGSEKLIKEVIEVAPVDENFSSSSDYILHQEATLKKHPKGQYWIIKVDIFYYLIPKIDILITKLSYQSLQNFFECYGYKTGLSKNIELLKPARVSVITDDEEWEFIQKGVIQFT